MTQKVRRAVAIYQMLTFVAALVNVGIVVAMPSPAIAPAMWVVIAVVLVLAVASLVAGIGLWQDRPAARRLSVVVQALQVPRIALGGIVTYSVALGLSLFLDIGSVPASMRQPVHLAIGLGGDAGDFCLGINFLALTALILVARWRPVGVVAAEHPAEIVS